LVTNRFSKEFGALRGERHDRGVHVVVFPVVDRERRCLIEGVKVNAARMVFLLTVIVAAAACNLDRATVNGFPGLAIKSTCREESRAAHYSKVDSAYPGERVSGDLLQPMFLGGIGELPLPCIDRRAEIYRFQQITGGEFGGLSLIVGIRRSAADSRIWVIDQRYGPYEAKVRRAERALLETEWDQLATELSAMGFWNQPARLLPDPDRKTYLYRGAWMVEGYNDSHYHGVSRFYGDGNVNPSVPTFLDLARPLLEAAK
jgi:hypothetical protein